MRAVPIYFAPDIDTAWSANPGALAAVNGLAPLLNGAYGSMGEANLFGSSTLTDNDIRSAYLFRQNSGSVRFLVFRESDIDEYDNAGTLTNRATGLTASTEWQAAAVGNRIIAVSKTVNAQHSTSGSFSQLAAIKARHVAVNSGYVLLADYDSGGGFVPDGIYTSLFETYDDFTANGEGQTAFQIVKAPGQITALVPFGEGWIVFKHNSMFMLTANYPSRPLFSARPLSLMVGCTGPQAVTELDGKLYFLHASGFYEFDGASLKNIGVPVHQSFLAEASFISPSGGTAYPLDGNVNAEGLAAVQAVADTTDGVVWFKTSTYTLAGINIQPTLYGYNARAQKWGRWVTNFDQSGRNWPRLVIGSTADAQAFKADPTGRFLLVHQAISSSTLRSIRYPVATPSAQSWTLTTGVFGSTDGYSTLRRVWPRMLKGSDAEGIVSGTVEGFEDEAENITQGSESLDANTAYDAMDVTIDAKFKKLTLTGTPASKGIIAGIAVDERATGTA